MQIPHINLRAAFTRVLIISAIIAFTSSTVKAQSSPQNGKVIFESNCTSCHGNDGTKGRWGAKNLRVTTLTDKDLFTTISKGRGIMPKWSKKLSSIQISEVIAYIKTFRN